MEAPAAAPEEDEEEVVAAADSGAEDDILPAVDDVDGEDEQLNELSGLDGDLSGVNDQLLDVGDDLMPAADGMISPRVKRDPAHVGGINFEEEENKDQPVAAAQGVDAALIKEVWPYLRCRQRVPGDGLIAHEGVEIAQELRQEVNNALGTVSASIEALT